MEIKDAAIVNKLILLFFIDKMDVALTESTILKACYYQNPWMEYMDCMSALNQLQESEFLFRAVYEKTAYYSITPGGRECISGFYTRIPASIRTDISEFVKDNRLSIRRRQEYTTSYSLNPDKTYGVSLKIIDPTNPQRITLDLKFNVPNKEIAKAVAEKWNAKAASIYSDLYEQLVDE